MSSLETSQLRTTCNRDCPDACGIVATIEDGRVVRLQGDRDHPVTRGFLCHRTSRFLERQYDPERITTPLARDGDQFHPISWSDAFDRIASTMLRIKHESGGAAILHYRCGGSMGLMKSVTDYFFERFGPVTIKSGDICAGAGDAAQHEDFGEADSHGLFDLLNSKTIVLWGKNLYVSSVHLIPILKEARRRGARIILIDPVWNRTTELCDTFIQPRPGGDIALTMGIARVLFDSNLHDAGAEAYCDHFDDFRSLARSATLEQWARQADVPVSTLELLAQVYAERPVATVVGWGLQRRARGSATIRTIDALGAVSGNLGIAGGGVSFYFNRRGAFDLSFLRGEEVAPRMIPEPMLGPGILEANDPPVRMVWVTAANPVAMLPESETVARALESRELTVVVDSFLTDTARRADLVLPTTTMLEDDDLLGSYGHHWLSELRPVVAPPDGVKTDYEMVQALAPRVGLGDEFSADVETWKRRMLAPVAERGASLDDLREGAVRNPLANDLLFADQKFATPSGRVNLIYRLPPAAKVEAEPKAKSEADLEAGPVAGSEAGDTSRPLLLMSLSTENVQGSQWVHGTDQGHLEATVHPSAALGFRDGDTAIVESELGRMVVRLTFDTRQRPDILLTPKGGWLRNGRCANALVRAEVTDAGGCAVYYDTPVRILPVDTQ